MTKKMQTKAAPTTPQPVVIVFGLNENGKPRGARFTSDKTDQAGEAAVSMKLEIHETKDGELFELAKKLPAGRIYARGRAFIPFIKRDLYEKLRTAAGGVINGAPVEGSKAGRAQEVGYVRSPIRGEKPQNWDVIKPGDLVLAEETAEGTDDGWWEALVTARDDQTLTLQFRDYPAMRPVKRHVSKLALINPRSE